MASQDFLESRDLRWPGISGFDVAAFREELEGAIPCLRSYARAWTHDADAADEMVRDAVVRALQSNHALRSGEIRSRLFTILINRPLHAPTDKNNATEFTQSPSHIERALAGLPEEQRCALLLVVLGGLSYREVANIQAVPVDTVMSRLSHARARISDLTSARSQIAST
jgi:RNA polymerase sigma-70 factor, ECF subfamily